ncbi:DoxX family protein [Sphingobium limneticum]|jgi:putative oxidoreductase|uniref:DoxX family protein n=1 Tax=Sphingobium limneticum TaxID=1007511 RepID=UPI003D04ED7A
MEKLDRFSPEALGVLRIITALLFLAHPAMTLFHFPTPNPFAAGGLSPLLLAAAFIELIGGILIAGGIFTRLVAFICSGEMAVAYFLVHAPRSFWPILNYGEPAIFFSIIFLYLAFAGPGKFAIRPASVWKSLQRAKNKKNKGSLVANPADSDSR